MLLSQACSHNDPGYFAWAWKQHQRLYPKRSLDEVVHERKSMLFLAVCEANPDMVRLCLDLGADPNMHSASEIGPHSADKRALHAAAESGNLDIVRVLLQAKAYINSETRHGRTPLWLAASNGHFEVVDFLISAGADTLVSDNNSTSPLEAAANANHDEIASLLQSHHDSRFGENMSSERNWSGKHHDSARRSPNQRLPEPWGEWTLDSARGKYFRCRMNANGMLRQSVLVIVLLSAYGSKQHFLGNWEYEYAIGDPKDLKWGEWKRTQNDPRGTHYRMRETITGKLQDSDCMRLFRKLYLQLKPSRDLAIRIQERPLRCP